jgi:hypothetical protein
MANIHFIWSGPPKGEISYETANVVAEIARSHTVYFWCQESYIEGFRAVLDRSITVRSCSLMNDIVPGYQAHANARWYTEAQGILQYLISAGAFAAAKDLLSLIILHTYGGYYFDTTTCIMPDRGAAVLAALPNPDAPKVPRVPGETPHQVGLQTAISILSGYDLEADETADPDDAVRQFITRVPLIDVWAMASPPNDNSFELMMMSYVSRCNRFGLNLSGFPVRLDRIRLSTIEIMASPEAGRNDLLGSLIVRSVLDGLIAIACNMDATQISNFYWTTIAISPEERERLGTFYVPELGINKHYRNTWR